MKILTLVFLMLSQLAYANSSTEKYNFFAYAWGCSELSIEGAKIMATLEAQSKGASKRVSEWRISQYSCDHNENSLTQAFAAFQLDEDVQTDSYGSNACRAGGYYQCGEGQRCFCDIDPRSSDPKEECWCTNY